MQYEKVCVEIEAKFLKEGGVRPAAIIWENGAKYPVERVKFIERAPARVSAILPVRYTCIVGGKEKFLWFEPELMRWFVEVKRE